MTFVLILCVLAAIVLAASYAIYRFAFYSPNAKQNNDENLMDTEQMNAFRDTTLGMIRSLNERPFERVYITSHDGLRLSGRYYHMRDGAPLDICFHGYRGTPSRDFSGGTNIVFSQGNNLLMIEERAHCTSEGHTITFGVKERYDCVDWVNYAVERFGKDTKIIICGISMGAATVLMASELGLPENVRGIVADCPYTSPKAIIKKVCRDMKVPADAAFPFVWLAARLFGGFDLNAADAADAVKHARIPILLIHGEADHFVPCEMGREIAANNPGMTELHTFPGAGHGLSYLVDTERYTEIDKAFHRRVMGENANI